MKTVCTPSIRSPRAAAGAVEPATVEAKTAPKSAAPTAPPRPREKLVAAIATPRRPRSTAFWTATTSTWPTMPKPRPKMASPIPIVSGDGLPAAAASSISARVIIAAPATGYRV